MARLACKVGRAGRFCIVNAGKPSSLATCVMYADGQQALGSAKHGRRRFCPRPCGRGGFETTLMEDTSGHACSARREHAENASVPKKRTRYIHSYHSY